jgi:O-acetyl-ADP-ribose deacetylase (regulator of RNase III)
MIRNQRGNILSSQAHAIVIPVNCVGVMGAGLARQFKEKYPELFVRYYNECMQGKLKEGECTSIATYIKGKSHQTVFILAATKGHWKNDSTVEGVRNCIENILKEVEKHQVSSVAIPAIGCGLGGLDWKDVEPMITETFSAYKKESTKIVDVYAPH